MHTVFNFEMQTPICLLSKEEGPAGQEASGSARPFTSSHTVKSLIEIMSSPLKTFNFKNFPKQRQTQFLNFLAQI